MDHSELDEVSLALAQCVAERLRAQPELVELARNNLARWSRQNASSKSLLRCYAEWSGILSLPVEAICAQLVAETEQGQRLRQNSPFAGVLSPAEVWQIKARHRHATVTA